MDRTGGSSSSSSGSGGMSGSKISLSGGAAHQSAAPQRARKKSQPPQIMANLAGPVSVATERQQHRRPHEARRPQPANQPSSSAAPEVRFTSAGLVVRPAAAALPAARAPRVEAQSTLDSRGASAEPQTVVINGNVYETHSAARLPSSVQSRAQSSSFASHFASPSHTRSRTVGHGTMQPRQLRLSDEPPTMQEEPTSYFGLGRSPSQAAAASSSPFTGADRVYSDSFVHPLGGSPVRLPPGRNFKLASAQRSTITHYTERPDESTGSAGVDLRQEVRSTIAGSALHVQEQTEDRIAGVTRRSELRALGDRASAQVHTRSASDQHGGWSREQLLRNLPADEHSTQRAQFEQDWQSASAALSSASHLPSLLHSPPKSVHAHRTVTHEISSPTRCTVERRSDSQSIHFDRQGHAHAGPSAAAVGSQSSSSPPAASSPVGSPQQSSMRSPMRAAAAATSPTASPPRSRSGTASSAPRTPTRAKGTKVASGSG